MQVIVDTDKLSKEAKQLINNVEDAQFFIIELIENQTREILTGKSNDSIIEILKRLEKKIDGLQQVPVRNLKKEVAPNRELPPNHLNSTHKINAPNSSKETDKVKEHEKAADELAKALDFFS
ncbi:hypothetical protein [Desulfuribacillus alkaliarsenatis]|uniref:Uncharacterized protein n=1 Tax=Desulfuribacillus alkaliarsenatis TaxID=766136 RepID=A0A1E5G0E1_9FIRM|nr:hypothetical protein [Desulfuribacillus alkaliarsenatis]OEF96284.1 hypothetical protein BHF68_08975 [Desulfuribacillus alkaliarsenatis]